MVKFQEEGTEDIVMCRNQEKSGTTNGKRLEGRRRSGEFTIVRIVNQESKNNEVRW